MSKLKEFFTKMLGKVGPPDPEAAVEPEKDQEQPEEPKEIQDAGSGGTKTAAAEILIDPLPRYKFQWSTDSLIALLSYNINIHCVWSLPYLAIKYGGASFLVPYAAVTVLIGYALYYMELGLGQYSSQGAISSWACAPFFRGIGYAAVVVTFFVSVYNAIILAWSFYYFGTSMGGFLPWKECSPTITRACSNLDTMPNCTETMQNRYCMNGTRLYWFGYNISQDPTHPSAFPESWKIPAEEFFHHDLLRITPSINKSGSPAWELLFCLLATWGLIALCLIRGPKSATKISYVTVILPVLICFAIFVQTLLIPGSEDGIVAFLNPDWSKLRDVNLWGEAALLAFITLFPNWGTVVTINSYSLVKDAFVQDAAMAPLGCVICSIFIALVPSALCGILAEKMHISVQNLVAYGPSFLFVIIPQALAELPARAFWSVLFYLVVILIGIDTLFWMIQTVVTSTIEIDPNRLAQKHFAILSAFISSGFLLGLAFICPSGLYVTLLFDSFAGRWNVLILALIEVCAIAGPYGVERFISHLREMLGYDEPASKQFIWFWRIMWTGIIPNLLLLMLIYMFAAWVPAHYAAYSFESWAQAVGWLIGLVPLLIIPGFMIFTLFNAPGLNAKQKMRNSVRPQSGWETEANGNAADTILPLVADADHKDAPRRSSSLDPPPEPYIPNRISITERAMKPNKVNRATQMSREIETQTGDEPPRTEVDENIEKQVSEIEKEKKRKRHRERKERHNHKNRLRGVDDGHVTPGPSGIKLPPLKGATREQREHREKTPKPMTPKPMTPEVSLPEAVPDEDAPAPDSGEFGVTHA